MPEDNLAQFKKILANLPEDRRKRLYDRLHAMPASQREAFINDFTRKYLSGQRKHPSKKTGTQVKTNVSGKKPSSPNGSSQKKSKPADGQAKKAQPANGQKKPQPSTVQTKKPQPANGQKKNVQPANGQKKPSASSKPQDKHPSPAVRNKAPDKHGTEIKHPVQSKASKPKTAPAKQPQKAESKKPAPLFKFDRKPAKAPAEIEPELINAEPVIIEEEPKEPPRSKEASLQSAAIGVLVALLIIGLGYIVYLFNKQKIDRNFNKMFGMTAEETIATTPDGLGIIGSEPTFVPSDTPTPVPATPTPTPITLKEDHPDLTGKVIVIDPGHQEVPNTELEKVYKGSTAEKDKATSGISP